MTRNKILKIIKVSNIFLGAWALYLGVNALLKSNDFCLIILSLPPAIIILIAIFCYSYEVAKDILKLIQKD